VAFLFAAFFVPLVRPHLWRSSGWTGRIVILVLVSIGVWHTSRRFGPPSNCIRMMIERCH
jgi:hypothetical protein